MKYDVIIVGGGPAGLSASIFCSRFGLNTLLISEEIGGLANEAPFVENYPGYMKTTGFELMRKFKEQALKELVEIKEEKIVEIKGFKVKTNENSTYEAKSLILALGSQKRKLNVPGEEKYLGKGVSYCSTCDGPLFRNKTVGIIGGGNCAVSSAITLSKHCKKVYLIHRRDSFKADEVLVKKVKETKNIEIVLNANVQKLEGNKFLEKVYLDNNKSLELSGLFIEIGTIPSSLIAKDLGVKLDNEGFVEVDDSLSTNIEGVFAAGDISTGSNKIWQISTAVGEGTIAATSVKDYLKKN